MCYIAGNRKFFNKTLQYYDSKKNRKSPANIPVDAIKRIINNDF